MKKKVKETQLKQAHRSSSMPLPSPVLISRRSMIASTAAVIGLPQLRIQKSQKLDPTRQINLEFEVSNTDELTPTNDESRRDTGLD